MITTSGRIEKHVLRTREVVREASTGEDDGDLRLSIRRTADRSDIGTRRRELRLEPRRVLAIVRLA